jgi:hypothetical protein
MVLTDALRASLRELISNPLQPAVPTEHAQMLIDMGLATRWADLLAVTLAGRRAAYSGGGES